MSFSNRPDSPIKVWREREGEPGVKEKRRLYDWVLEEKKIHRIKLANVARCEVLTVESPNCVWLRLCTSKDVIDTLRYVKPAELVNLEPGSIEPYDYVMAPLSEDTYARGRVVKLMTVPFSRLGKFAYVFFIDDGYAQWMSEHCLAEMEPHLYSHPWQAFPISLVKLHPPNAAAPSTCHSGHQPMGWSPSDTALLARLLFEYESLRVVPCHDSREGLDGGPNTYYEYARVELYGLREGEEFHKGESVAHRFTFERVAHRQRDSSAQDSLIPTGSSVLERPFFDAAQQPLQTPHQPIVPTGINEMSWSTMLDSFPEWLLSFPQDFNAGLMLKPIKKRKKKQRNGAEPFDLLFSEPRGGNLAIGGGQSGEEDSESEDFSPNKLAEAYKAWDPEYATAPCYPTVPRPTLHLLQSKGYCAAEMSGGEEEWRIVVCVDWPSLRGPDEFYAFPVKLVDSATSNSKLMESVRLAREELRKQLDPFYATESNRHSVDMLRIQRSLSSGHEVFAIRECYDDHRMISEYQRVQILALGGPSPQLSYADAQRNCLVRFVDTGGSAVVPVAALFAIHSTHCQQQPLCLHLCCASIRPAIDQMDNGADAGDGGGSDYQRRWSDEAKELFIQLIRTDVPMECDVTESEQAPALVDSRTPSRWPDVIRVLLMRARSASVTTGKYGSGDNTRIVMNNGIDQWENKPIEMQMVEADAAEIVT